MPKNIDLTSAPHGAVTLGELRALTASLPDDTPLTVNNQAIQSVTGGWAVIVDHEGNLAVLP